MHHSGSSLLGQNHNNPGLHGKFVVFLEKHFMHSRCSLHKQIAKSQSESKNVFLKSKKRKLSEVGVQF